jgi:hypothetical protein
MSHYTFLPRYETSRSRYETTWYETTRLRNVLHPSILLRIRFSADLTMLHVLVSGVSFPVQGI